MMKKQLNVNFNLFKSIFGGGEFVFNCKCYKLSGFEVFQNCVNVRYVLNFAAGKICVGGGIPEEFEKKLIRIVDYLKSIKNEPFFYFGKYADKIHLSLDNPNFKEIKNVKNFGN